MLPDAAFQRPLSTCLSFLCSYLNDNFFSGSLPDAWSSPGSFPQLTLLRIDGNALSGTLPTHLGSVGVGGNASAANMPNLLVL